MVLFGRFPLLLDLLPPERVASKIVKAMRRNYKELSLPTPMLTLDRISRYDDMQYSVIKTMSMGSYMVQ